ncbi:uncharacterized protein [Chironomus tepperi]|uniref:uncharacterized protein n=1 Tax=Chironomus tepperi TaxID=113505 RepID=UPI00391F7857
MSRLSKIVHKIANYVPWQSEGLTEDEFKVLDQAKGIELADIAYNNRINFNRFLKNADKMIDAYNENLVWTQIKEVRALKRCLLNPGSFTTKKPQASPEKVKQSAAQRIQNDDNVVPQMELPQNSPEHVINVTEQAPEESRVIDNELVQTVPKVRTFVSSLLADNSGLSRSIPMHRNIIRETKNITLHQEKEASNFDNLLENDEMPILNEMEMAKMGIFDGLHGKKISKVLHQREEAASLPSLSLDADLAARNMQPLELDMNPPSVDNMDNLLLTPGDHYDIPDLSPLPGDEQQIQPPQIDEQQNQIIVEQINPDDIPIPNVSVEKTQNENENAENARDSMAERADSFRNAVEAFEGFLGRARRVHRKGKVQQNRPKQPQIEEDSLTMLKLRKDVPFKTKRRNRARSMKQIKLPIVDLDFFGDIEVFIANDLPFDDEQPEAEVPQRRESDFNVEFDPTTTRHHVATSTPMVTAQKHKRINSSPEQLDQQPKRTRLETLDDVRNFLIDLPNIPNTTESMAPIPEVPQELTDIEVPALNPSISAQQPAHETPFSVPRLPQLEPSLTIPSVLQESNQSPKIDQQERNEPLIPPPPIQRESLAAVPELPELDMELPIAESSREQSIPQMRKQSRLEILQNLHITPDSIDYDRLRRNSKLRKTPIDSRLQLLPEEIFQNACENISEREAAKIRSSLGDGTKESPLPMPEILPKMPRAISAPKPAKDKFGDLPRLMKNGDKCVELKSNDGTKKMHFTEHQLSCMTLYFKIRFLMHEIKGTGLWRMTIKELFSKLKDLKESKAVTYQQLKHMTQLKLFTAKWSDDDELLEIEIPINRIEEVSDKENLPSVSRVSTRQALRTRQV